MPEYNVSRLQLPNGDILNLPGGSAATYYGTCNSAAGAQIKAVTVSSDQNFSLKKGALIGILFYNTNTYSSTVANPVQLNVNSTGAKLIKYGEAAAGATTGTEPNAYGYADRITYYMYDGTNWVWVSQGKDTLINLTSTASSTNETDAITPKGVYNTINNNAMSQSEAETGTSTIARTISAATLKAAIEEHSGAATEWLSETTISSGSTETTGIEYTITTTNYKDGTTDTTYNNTFTVKNGTSSRPGVVYLTSTSADSSSASGTGDKTAATPLCVYNSIHDTDNALTIQNISAGTDDTTAYTITASRLAYAAQAHDHLVDFKPAITDPLVYDNTSKKLTLNADMDYYYRDSTGHPGAHDLDIESTGYLEVPYGDNSNPGILKLSSAAATSSSASGNSDYTAATPKAVYDSIRSSSNAATTSDYGVTELSTDVATSSASSSLAATPKCVYDSIHSSSNAATTSTYGSVKLMDVSIVTTADSRYSDKSVATAKCVYDSIHSADNKPSYDDPTSYGVVRLSSSYNIASPGQADKSYAANTYAVAKTYQKADSAYDLADSKADKATTFSINISTSISASDYQYSAMVSNGIVTINFRIAFSSAPTSDNYLKLFTGIPSSYRPPYSCPGSAMTSSCATKTIWVSSGGNILGALKDSGISANGWLIGSVSYSYDSSNWVD